MDAGNRGQLHCVVFFQCVVHLLEHISSRSGRAHILQIKNSVVISNSWKVPPPPWILFSNTEVQKVVLCLLKIYIIIINYNHFKIVLAR